MLIQDTRNYPAIVELHEKDENGEEYDDVIHVNASVIAYYFDREGLDGKECTCVVLTNGEKLLTRETAAEIDRKLLNRLFE